MSLQTIFFIIFCAVSAVYLVTLIFKPCLFQFILKGCLMPLVFAIYFFGVNEKVFLPVVLALLFAWIGDVLLVRITNILWFKLGLASFLVGHICYCIAMFGFINFNFLVLGISAILAAAFCIVAYRFVKPSKQMKIPVIAYEIIITTMAALAFQFFLSVGSVVGTLVFAGSICFVISDTLLALKTFRRAKVYFAVMVTYIAAQFLIVYGFSLI